MAPLRRGLRAAGLLGAGAGLGAVGIGAVTAWTLNGPQRPDLPYFMSPFEVGADAEDVRFHAPDGVELAGWWFDRTDSELVVIVCHGHRSNKSEMLGLGPGLWRAGHTVLAFDFRGCGESADGPQSLAFHEQRDLSAAIDLAGSRRPDAKVVLVGFSMGASTALLCAADDPRVAAVVLDSPFATMSDVVVTAYRKYRLPGVALLPVADLVNRLRYGYAFAHVRPIDAIERIPPRPIMLLHGTADRIIPYGHAEQLLEAAGGAVELVTFVGADHCGGYFLDRPGYIARVDDFLRRRVIG